MEAGTSAGAVTACTDRQMLAYQRPGSGENFLDNLAAKDGRYFVSIVMVEGETVLIDSQGVQQRSVHVGRGEWTFDRDVTQFVCRSDDLSTFDAAAGKPHSVSGR